MDLKSVPSKLIGSKEERAVSPVIGVILMVAITVILAAVIAAFVLDIGPGDPNPNAAVNVENDGSSAVTVELQSTEDNTDGVAIYAEEELEDGEIEEGDVLEVITTSGAEERVEWSDDWDDASDDDADFSIRAFSGDPDDVSSAFEGEEEEDRTDYDESVDSETILEEFTVVDPDPE